MSEDGRPLPLLTADEMRAWERAAFEGLGISERVVMESAGRAAALAIAQSFPEGRVVGAIGRGNNGGDAVVALRTLRAWGRDVCGVLVGGGTIEPAMAHGWDIPLAEDPARAFHLAGVLVDGILGTGASGAPRAAAAEAVQAMNASGRPIVALDGPTGVDLDTGVVAGEAIRAQLTVTFGALKRGLVLFPGRGLAGRILLAEVGFPPFTRGGWGAEVVTEAWARARLPAVPLDAHKGRVGIVAIVAGRKGVGGAAIMAAMGALRAGCGGVRVISSEANRVPVQSAVPEAVFYDRDAPAAVEALDGVAAVLIGPGIGTDDAARELMRRIFEAFDGPCILDADALTLVARDGSLLDEKRAGKSLLTPHPGELGRLLGSPTAEVVRDRLGAAQTAAERFGTAVLAKGAPSVVATRSDPVLVAVTGHSGVATGGMGDTLAGIAAAMLAGGACPRDAGGAALHFAGRAAEAGGRGRGLLPRDVAEALPAVLRAELPTPVPPLGFLLELAPAS